MKTENREIVAYEYEDLIKEENRELLEKVLYKEYDVNTSHDWYCFSIEDWQEKLTELGYTNTNIHFNISYSQSDYGSFYGNVDIETILKRMNSELRFNLESEFINNVSFEVKESRNSNYINDSNWINTGYDNINNYFELIHNEIFAFLEEDIKEINREIYQSFCKELEYLQSEEAILETIQANDYNFDSDGTMINI